MRIIAADERLKGTECPYDEIGNKFQRITITYHEGKS